MHNTKYMQGVDYFHLTLVKYEGDGKNQAKAKQPRSSPAWGAEPGNSLLPQPGSAREAQLCTLEEDMALQGL